MKSFDPLRKIFVSEDKIWLILIIPHHSVAVQCVTRLLLFLPAVLHIALWSFTIHVCIWCLRCSCCFWKCTSRSPSSPDELAHHHQRSLHKPALTYHDTSDTTGTIRRPPHPIRNKVLYPGTCPRDNELVREASWPFQGTSGPVSPTSRHKVYFVPPWLVHISIHK